jgi:hypothetical protein
VNVLTDALAVAAYGGALVADQYIKLGWRFDPQEESLPIGGSHYLHFFADNVYLASKQIPSAAGTDFPNDVLLAFVFATLNATATTPGDNSIDWVKVGQLGV